MAEQKAQQMPIFSKSYDMLVWLLQVTQHFPRAHRHDYTKRLLDAAFDFRECLEVANLRRAGARLEYLHKADVDNHSAETHVVDVNNATVKT